MKQEQFRRTELKELERGIDGSKQFILSSNLGGNVNFSINEGFLWLHSWKCPGEGKKFLDEFEDFSIMYKLKIRVPTVLSPKLEKILSSRNYEKKRIWSDELDSIIEFFTIRIKKLRDRKWMK